MRQVSFFVVLLLLFSCSVSAQEPFSDVKIDINSVQNTNPTLPDSPSGSAGQKGLIGNIIANIFTTSGKIRNEFLDFIDVATNTINAESIEGLSGLTSSDVNKILKWGGGELATTNIYENGGNIGIGKIAPTKELDVVGDINFTGDLYKSGTKVDFTGKWKNGLSAGDIYYSSGSVGIGTANPNAPLDIGGVMFLGKGGGNITIAPDISFHASGLVSSDASLHFMLDQDNNSTNQSFQVLTNDSKVGLNDIELFRINEDGSVGIGTSSPQGKLHINTTTDASLTSNNHALTIGDSSGYNLAIDGNEILARNNGVSDFLHLSNDGGGITVNNAAAASARFKVDSNGNVGIGTSSPQKDLDVAGTVDGFVRLDGSDGTLQLRNNNTTNVWKINAAGTSGETNFLIQDNGDSHFAIDNSGKIGIGTTSMPSKLNISGGGDISSANDQSAALLLTQTDLRLAIDANEMQASNNGSAGAFVINPHGGGLGIGGFPASGLKLDVNGKIGASQYCDGAGNNCTNANDLRTKCTALGHGSLELTNSEESSAGLSTGDRHMIMPDSISRRCRQKGYDFGFALDLFRNKSGARGWCGFSNAKTVFYAGQAHKWMSTSAIGGSCINGSVELAYCCHID